MTPEDVERWTLQIGNGPWFHSMERFCANSDIICQGGTVRCFVFTRWQYHPEFKSPGHRLAFCAVPITPEFDPLNGIGSVDLSLPNMIIIKD
jgi:hypothetical protein